MIAKAIVRFTDKKEKKVREVNDRFEVTKDRFEEILKVGNYVEKVEQPKKTPNKKKGD